MLSHFPKWMRNRRFIRRCVAYGFASLVVLVIAFYAEEDWRGKHDWEKYQREWEAKGERFDFASFIPPPVPDDQNFALTPIVAGTYGEFFFDDKGRSIIPTNTNLLHRLDFPLKSPPELKAVPTNVLEGNWRLGRKTDLNGYQTYYRSPVIKYKSRNHSRMNGTRWDTNEVLNATNDFPVAAQPKKASADVLLALSRYDVALQELREGTRRPFSRFQSLHSDPERIDLNFAWQPLLQCRSTLELRACAEVDDGQNEKAMDDVKLLLYLANALREENFITARFSALSLLNSTLQPIWEGLVDHKWSDSQLIVIEAELSKFDLLTDYQSAVRSERALFIGKIDEWEEKRTLRGICAAFTAPPSEYGYQTIENSGLAASVFYLIPTGWFYQNDLTIARTFQQALLADAEVSRRMFNRQIPERTELSINRGHLSPDTFLANMFLDSIPRWVQRFAFAQSSLDFARVACALERYRVAHGEYPVTLDELSPLYIDKVPNDLINDLPLHYRRTDDGAYLLYSVGWNGTDDHGTVGG